MFRLSTDLIHEPGLRELGYAIRRGDVAAVRRLLREGALKGPDHRDAARVMQAAIVAPEGYQGDQIVRALLDFGIDPTEELYDFEWTPLHVATYDGNVSRTRLLLDTGVDPDQGGFVRFLPLMAAALGGDNPGNREVMALLLDRGADIDAHDEYVKTALIHAIECGYAGNVWFLLMRGACAEPPARQPYQNKIPNSPLMDAVAVLSTLFSTGELAGPTPDEVLDLLNQRDAGD